MKHKNVDCQKEDQRNGNHTVENEYNGELIQNHTEEAGGEGKQDQSKQKPTLHTQLLSVSNGMDDVKQQENHRCQLMDIYTGEGNHDRHNKTNE